MRHARWFASPCWRLGLATVLAAIVAAPMASPPPAAAQEPVNEAFPPLAGGGPPAWVVPGTRLSWYGAAASIQSSYYTYVEDPEGDWEDPATGKRYRQTEEGEMPTAAGHGVTQTDVLAVEGEDVILSTSLWAIDLETGQLSLQPLGGGRYPGGAVDGAWVRPDLLAQIPDGGTTELRVLRGPYELGETTVQAVAFVSRAEGDYGSTVFDTDSGALVASTGRYKGAGSPVHGPLDDPEGNVQVMFASLVDVRERALPGLGAAVPDWVVPGAQLVYQGEARVTNPFDAGGFSTGWPVELRVTLDEVGSSWATFESSTATDFDGYVQRTEASGATGSTGLYWYDLAALAAMTPGTILDEDPVTTAMVSVESADGTVVTLLTEAPGVTARATYEIASGVLTSLVLEQGYGAASLELVSTS
jgi:hypothetical protein